MRLTYAIVFVSDMNRSVEFYRDVLGLTLKFQTPHWTEFNVESATLALHAAEAPAATRDNPDKTPPGRCRPGLSVPDLNDFHRRMIDGHVTCVQPPKENFGTKIAQYLDPDGLPISVSEQRRA